MGWSLETLISPFRIKMLMDIENIENDDGIDTDEHIRMLSI